MKKTKLVALGLAAALVVGLFGCGDKTTGNTSSESKTSSDEKKVVTLGVMTASSITDWDDNLLTAAVEEQFNVECEFLLLPSASADFGTKVTLMATSDPDSMPDMIMGDGVLGSSQQLELGDAGVFQPIEDYVLDPAKTPYFNSLPENIIADMLAVMQQPDGHIYGFADHTANPSTSNPEKMWLNTAWLETLKLEAPVTTDDLKEVLIAMRDGDPNGNKVQDEIGVYGRRQGWGEDTIACLMNSFVETSWNNGKFNGGLACDQKTGDTVVAPFTLDSWKEGIKYLNELYDEGLFAASSFTDDDTTYKATINQNPPIVALVDMASNTWITDGDIRDQYTYQIPFVGPEGYSWFPTRCSSFNTEVVFTCTGEQLDLCVAIQDAMYDHSTPESLGIIRMGRGVYGTDWTDDAKTLATTSNLYVEAGLVDELTYAQLTKKPDQHNWNWGGFGAGAPENGIVWSTGANLYDGVYDIKTASDAWMVTFLEAVDSEKYVSKILPVLNYTTEEIDELGDIRSNVVGYVNSFLAECVTGVQDVEKNWDAYIKELDKMGLQTWLDMAQKVLDRQK